MVRFVKKMLCFATVIMLLVNMMAYALAGGFETPTVNLDEAVVLDESGLVPNQTETPTPGPVETATPTPEEQPTEERTQAPTVGATDTPAPVVTPAPTQNEQPTAAPTQAVTPEPTETPDPTEAPERKIITECFMEPVMSEGDEFILKATLVGFEDVNVKVQWQYDLGDEHGYRNAEGESNELIFRVKANAETLNAKWRIVVTIVE